MQVRLVQKNNQQTKAKLGTGISKAKAYIFASQLQFLDKIFEDTETEDTFSQNIDEMIMVLRM